MTRHYMTYFQHGISGGREVKCSCGINYSVDNTEEAYQVIREHRRETVGEVGDTITASEEGWEAVYV